MSFESVYKEIQEEHQIKGIVIGSMALGHFVENPNTERNLCLFIYKQCMKDLMKNVAESAVAKMKDMGLGDVLEQ